MAVDVPNDEEEEDFRAFFLGRGEELALLCWELREFVRCFGGDDGASENRDEIM